MRKSIDVHCHLTDDTYKEEKDIFTNCENVEFLLISGTNEEDSKNAVEIAKQNTKAYATVGVHPHDSEKVSEKYIENLEKLAKSEKVVAIGEIGLDYHYEPYNKAKQKQVFKEQLELARKLNLPVVIHQRDTGYDVLEILKEKISPAIILHCFSESEEMAREYMKMDAYFSFGGTLTYKNNKKGVEVVKMLPLERILTETDSPYLSPEGRRGKKNYPKYSENVITKIAEIKGLEYEEVYERVRENVKEVFGK